MKYQPNKFDIGILRADGTNVGLMLVKKGGVPQYAVFDDEYLSTQFFTGVPGYSSLPAEKELAIRQESWRSGFGLNVFDADDPERYFSSQGMDMRFRGMAIAGPNPTALSNVGGVTWTAPTGHLDPSGTWADEAKAYDANYSTYALDSVVYPIGWTEHIYLTHAGVTADKISFTALYNSVAITNCNADVYYGAAWHALGQGVHTNYLPFIMELGSSETITNARVTFYKRVLDSEAARLWEFSFGSSTATGGKITCQAIFNDKQYASRGNALIKLNALGDGWSEVQTFPANITALEPFTDDKLYIALGFGYLYWEMNTNGVFTESDLGVNAKYMKTVHSATPTMWCNDAVNRIRSTTDPSNGGEAWSGQTVVDTSANEITNLLAKSGALYIMKEDIPYYLDSDGAVRSDIAPELATLSTSTNNGKNAFIWLNKLYLPWGDQALLEYDTGENTWRNPADFSTSLPQFNGRVTAVAGDDRYLFAVLDNGSIVYVLAGRLESIAGNTVWVWHPIAEVPISGCEIAWVSSVVQKRLWISSTDNTENLYYIPLPTGYGNVLSDANANFATNVAMETPYLHANFKDTDKSIIKLTTILGHSYNAGVFFQAHYRTLENSSYTFIGNAAGTSSSMVNTLYIPTSPTPTSTMFRLKFTANTLATDLTPVLLGYNLQALLYPPRRKIIVAQVRADNELTLKDGTPDVGSADTIAATLGEAREATWPVTLYNLNGDVNYVKFLSPPPGIPFWEPTKMEKGRVMEAHFNLVMQEVNLG